MTYRPAARMILVLVCLCGCAAAAELPGIWLDVPFVRQSKEGCGSAVITMVMQYWSQQAGRAAGIESEQASIQEALYSKPAHGIYASDVEHYLEEHGFRAFPFRGSWTDLRQHIEKGRPLIVALKPSGNGSTLHFVVVAGIVTEPQEVLINDPAERKLLKRDWKTFESEWHATGNWTLLAVPRPAIH